MHMYAHGTEKQISYHLPRINAQDTISRRKSWKFGKPRKIPTSEVNFTSEKDFYHAFKKRMKWSVFFLAGEKKHFKRMNKVSSRKIYIL